MHPLAPAQQQRCAARLAACRVAFDYVRCPSVDEGGPADVVAANLIFQHEVSNLVRKLPALPFALDLSCVSAARICSSGSLDRIGGGTEVVLGNMAYAGGLTRGVGREPRGSSQRPSCPHRMPADRSSLHHLHTAIGPCPRRVDRLAGARICRLLFLEQIQDVLSAGGGPEGQKLVIRVGERAAAADRHQARVADAGKDHARTLPARSSPPAFVGSRTTIRLWRWTDLRLGRRSTRQSSPHAVPVAGSTACPCQAGRRAGTLSDATVRNTSMSAAVAGGSGGSR